VGILLSCCKNCFNNYELGYHSNFETTGMDWEKVFERLKDFIENQESIDSVTTDIVNKNFNELL
jgi:predicted small metal-binding protein